MIDLFFIMAWNQWKWYNLGALPEEEVFPLTSLPPELVQHVLSFLSFEKLSQLKMVNRFFNDLCQSLLLKGYVEIKQESSQCKVFAESKLLPFAQYFAHPSNKVYHMVNIVDRGLSFVHLVYKCENVDYCFVPGKVLDEARLLLLMGKTVELPPDPRKTMENFMDLCERAKKYFNDILVPLYLWHCWNPQFGEKYRFEV